MKQYVSVLDDIICLDEIKKIKILYHYTTDYGNKWLHKLWVVFKDGTKEEYSTNDYSKANRDYENLKSALLGICDDITEKGVSNNAE